MSSPLTVLANLAGVDDDEIVTAAIWNRGWRYLVDGCP